MDTAIIAGDESSISPCSSPRHLPTYGTKFCLVAVPSPKMQRPNQIQDDVKDSLTSSSDTAVTQDNRLAHPAAYDGVDGGTTKEPSSRLDKMLDTLRKDLKSLQQQDQMILRQFLTIYQTISDIHCGDMHPHPPLTPPPEPGQKFQFEGSAALSPAIEPDEVRDLVSYQGQLNIRDVVSRLSPIKRQRTTSEPFLDDESISLDNSTEDLMSLSSPFL